MEEEAARDFWGLFGDLQSREAQALDREEVDGKSCNVVRITKGGAPRVVAVSRSIDERPRRDAVSRSIDDGGAGHDDGDLR